MVIKFINHLLNGMILQVGVIELHVLQKIWVILTDNFLQKNWVGHIIPLKFNMLHLKIEPLRKQKSPI